MTTMNPNANARWLLIGQFLLALIFALSFPQWPLYSSHQNTYLLHGLANAGVGFLNGDWLAHTTDPYPTFSALVTLTIRTLGENAFYLFFTVLVAIYGYSILGIASTIFGIDDKIEKYLTYFVLLTLVASGLLASVLIKVHGLSPLISVVGPDGILTRGVADQSILGQIFQPSLFGVFLVLSIFFFLRDRPFLAVASSAIAATFHSSYFLGAGILTGIYMAIILIREKDYRKVLLVGATSLVLIAPAVIYAYLNFYRPTSPTIFAQAQSILVDDRIPYHTIVAKWFGGSAVFQIVIIMVALYLVRRTRIFPILLGLFLVSALLTVVQMLTGSKSLAILLPWRISAVLVPIATSLILAKLVTVAFQILNSPLSKWVRPLQVVALVAAVVLGYLGVQRTVALLHAPRAGLTPSVSFVASAYRPGDVYLVPTDMELFRMAAKVPILADFQSNPYKDTDVVEWFNRVELANSFYSASGNSACAILASISAKYGVTDVVLRNPSSIASCGLVHQEHVGTDFVIYDVGDAEARADLLGK